MSDRWAGTSWRIVSVGDTSITGEATLGFDGEGRVFGRSVVNRFFGSYQVEGAALVVGPLGATLMASSPEAMAEEQLVLHAFDGPLVPVDGDDGTVLLLGGSADVRLAPTDPSAAEGTLV